jgi:hypothetical protein
MRDPLLKWYAERTEIRWPHKIEDKYEELIQKGKTGKIYTNGEPIYRGHLITWMESSASPSYYFIHGERRGNCWDSSIVNHVILKLKGYKCLMVYGEIPTSVLLWNACMEHQWNEVYVDGEVYVVDYNDVIPRDDFYEKSHWRITSPDYDSEWYKEPSTFSQDFECGY